MPDNGAGATPQNQGTGGAESFVMPEKLRGKSIEEMARVYVEGEKTWGARADYDTLKQRVSELEPQSSKVKQYEEALQAWEQYRPALEKIGWDTRKLQQQTAPSAPSGPATLEQYAQRWGELDVSQQLPYLLNDVLIPAYRADRDQLITQIAGALKQSLEQQNTYYSQKEKLMFSMLKALLPDKDIDGLYKSAYAKAEEMSKGGYDPFQAHLEAQLSEKKREEDWKKREEQIRADMKREYDERGRARVVGTTQRTAGQPAKGKKELRDMALKNATTVLSSL